MTPLRQQLPRGMGAVECHGVTIEDSSRVLVEVPHDEVGCGDEHRPIRAFQIEQGDAISFELVHGEPGERPQAWFGEIGASFESEPAVRGRQFRVACPAGTEAVATELAAHRSIWEAAGIHTYDFTLRYATDFLYGTYRISVVEAEPISAERLEEGAIKDYMAVPELPKTIDEVFDQLERELGGDRFVGEFNDALGYPTHVFVDRTENAVDDEWEFYITDLVIGSDQTALDTSLTAPTT